MRCILYIGSLLVAVVSLNAQDWPQWRGANRDGVTTAAPPAEWADRAALQWKVAVGIGHSSPVVAAGRGYVHARQGEREVVSAIDLTSGKVLWTQGYDAPYQLNPVAAQHGKGPKSTPVIRDGILYTLGISGILTAFDASTGASKWRMSFTDRFPETWPHFGVAMSPLVDRGLVIAHVGGHDRGALVALDARSGEVKWSWDGDGPAYASPIVVEIGGVRQVVTQTQRYLVGVDASAGTLLWRTPFTTMFDQNIVTPVRHKDLLIFSGLSEPTFGVRISRGTGGWKADRVWENPQISMYMNSPVVAGDWLFGLSQRNKGQIVCLDAASGKTMWESEGRQGENAALVVGSGVLYVLTNEGELILAKATPKSYEPIRSYTVADTPTWAHPVVLGDRVLIKDENTLASWSIAKSGK